jgi:hypothetical protein
MMSNKPLALVLADILGRPFAVSGPDARAAAAELHRLHARVRELEAAPVPVAQGEPVAMLESVLCGPDGKCCIDGSDADRAVVDSALAALRAASAPVAQPLSPAQIWVAKLNAKEGGAA